MEFLPVNSEDATPRELFVDVTAIFLHLSRVKG
jgi:hypothetical protein